jgi:hypothetical protein
MMTIGMTVKISGMTGMIIWTIGMKTGTTVLKIGAKVLPTVRPPKMLLQKQLPARKKLRAQLQVLKMRHAHQQALPKGLLQQHVLQQHHQIHTVLRRDLQLRLLPDNQVPLTAEELPLREPPVL